MTYERDGRRIDFSGPRVMAVVNLTPDSFFDGGKYGHTGDALADIESKLSLGADLIDLGAASSRPGAPDIPEEDEWRRLERVLRETRRAFPNAILSIDTWRATIAERAAQEGADFINDISGGTRDPRIHQVVAKTGLIYAAMHMDGTPLTMAQNPPYPDVTRTVMEFFSDTLRRLRALGVRHIVLDPGFGFGKSLRNNYELLKHLPAFRSLGCPLMVGVSRKSMINRVLQTNPVTALNGTTVLHTIALLNGASVLRVHDVEEAKQAVELVRYYQHA